MEDKIKFPANVILIDVAFLNEVVYGAYLRLKNVTLGYTFPANVLSKTKFISYARIYVSGADLWENSKIKDGWDPEASRKVETFGRYPFTRNLTVGLNLTF